MEMEDNPAAIPTPSQDLFGDGRWMSLHKRFVTEAKEKEPEIVFIGDSILAYLSYTETWEKLFVPMHSINFGIGGERVENVLWRVCNGEIDEMQPKAIIILVGTNNHGNSAQQIFKGIDAIVSVCREKQPQSEIIVLGLLPRGEHPNLIRDRNHEVNLLLKQALPSREKTHFIDIDPGFVQADGTLSPHDLWDYLHLTKSSYQKVFEPVCDYLINLNG